MVKKLENRIEREENWRVYRPSKWHKFVVGVEGFGAGMGIYVSSLGYHSDNKNLAIGGATLLTAGLIGLVYSFLKNETQGN